MSRNKQILVELESIKSELNHLFRDWELISGCSLDEFDHLSNQILSHLWKGADKTKIFNIIRSELITRYGLSTSDEDAQQIADEVFELWETVTE
jgi:hypothetical protein